MKPRTALNQKRIRDKISKRKANNVPCIKKDARSIKRSLKSIDPCLFVDDINLLKLIKRNSIIMISNVSLPKGVYDQ